MVRRVLNELLGTPGAAQHAVPRRPQLLSVDLRAQHRALLETLGSYGLTASDAAQAGSDCIVQLLIVASALVNHEILASSMAPHLLLLVQICVAAPELLAENAGTFRPVLTLLQEQGFEVRIRLACFCARPQPSSHAALALVSLGSSAF
jgi:hypothetical protein